MKWSFDFLPEARKEFNDLDGSVKPAAAKMIDRVRDNPLPASEGGYGSRFAVTAVSISQAC